jgi:ribosomal protein S18 acetylase RimI-like enzyme
VGSTGARVAGPEDAPRVAEIFLDTFRLDPVWGWELDDRKQEATGHAAYWRYYVDAALPLDSVWLTEDSGAAAVWIPPGFPEIPEEDEAKFVPMVTELAGREEAEFLVETMDRFEAAHPRHEQHYYLSLLGTHSDFRGRGLGMQLLAHTLERIDEQGKPAYLESTNPGNNHRYERHGFTRVGEFSLPEDGPPVATMWREARG